MSVSGEANNWYVSVKMQSLKQAKVQLVSSKKSYDYVSRFPIKEGDKVVIGYSVASGSFCKIEKGPNAGKIGEISEVKDKRTLKLDHAVELDYVFSKNPEKKDMKACVKYLENNDYRSTMQYGADVSPVRPINHFIRRILCASSILANRKLVDSAAIELATESIKHIPEIEDKIYELFTGMWAVAVDLRQIFATEENSDQELKDISGNRFMPEGFNESDNITEKQLLKSDEIKKYIEKYTYLGAYTIMKKAGLNNMLDAFLSVDSPAKEYI